LTEDQTTSTEVNIFESFEDLFVPSGTVKFKKDRSKEKKERPPVIFKKIKVKKARYWK
jgi:hypothetical protein